MVHELYHVDPEQNGIRRIERGDGTYSAHCHGHRFFEQVAAMVTAYLDSGPDPAVYGFLQHDFDTLVARFGGVAGTTFRTFPSFPQRYIEPLGSSRRRKPAWVASASKALRMSRQPTCYTEDDLHTRQFLEGTASRRV